MKRVSIIIVVILFLYKPIFCQSEVILRPNRISIGYGIGNLSKAIFKLSNKGKYDFSYKGKGPYFFKYERLITPYLGIGLNISNVSAKVGYDFKEKYTTDSTTLLKANLQYTSTSYLIRANLHPLTKNKIDPYLGVGVGYRDSKLSISTNDPATNNHELGIRLPLNFGFEATIGCNFMLSNNIGFYTEIGLSKAILQFGITGAF